MLKSIHNTLRKKVQYAIKNKADISDLIVGYDISNLDLTGAIISKLDLTNETITGTNFAYCLLGTDIGGIVFNNATLVNCCFQDARFPGIVMARRTKFIGCMLVATYAPYIDHAYAEFKNTVFCETVFRLGARVSLGAKFDDTFMGALSKYWAVKLVPNDEYEEFLKWKGGEYGKKSVRTEA